jgi:hypothetical protein
MTILIWSLNYTLVQYSSYHVFRISDQFFFRHHCYFHLYLLGCFIVSETLYAGPKFCSCSQRHKRNNEWSTWHKKKPDRLLCLCQCCSCSCVQRVHSSPEMQLLIRAPPQCKYSVPLLVCTYRANNRNIWFSVRKKQLISVFIVSANKMGVASDHFLLSRTYYQHYLLSVFVLLPLSRNIRC